jgi:wyosine [tRNA(Phe)-imidazoG37] synthetase (radical SAM superfamily)
VYVVISARAHGLSIGINMNPDQFCNFDCVYCEVNRDIPPEEHELDVTVMAAELEKTLLLIQSGAIRQFHSYADLPADLLRLQHVAFSGDGEPTLSREFPAAVREVVQVRARRFHPYFKLVLITNGTRLNRPAVEDGLRYFTREDEIWIKLDAGTQEHMDRVNRSEVSLEKVLQNARVLGRQRPIVIQSLFPSIDGQEPSADEIDKYIERLSELTQEGAKISQVQIYSATRPTRHPECGHISLKCLDQICRQIRAKTGLKAVVY